jgi:hypothetical protein
MEPAVVDRVSTRNPVAERIHSGLAGPGGPVKPIPGPYFRLSVKVSGEQSPHNG